MTEENIKLFDSELKVMDVLWKDGECVASTSSERNTRPGADFLM